MIQKHPTLTFISISLLAILVICSCKSSSKIAATDFSNAPLPTSSVMKITTHYKKDSLRLLLSDVLLKMHIDIVSANDNGIITRPKQRDKVFYKYRLQLSDGQVLISGKYEVMMLPASKPHSSPSTGITIYYGDGGMINARGFEDVKIMATGIDDAGISYSK